MIKILGIGLVFLALILLALYFSYLQKQKQKSISQEKLQPAAGDSSDINRIDKFKENSKIKYIKMVNVDWGLLLKPKEFYGRLMAVILGVKLIHLGICQIKWI